MRCIALPLGLLVCLGACAGDGGSDDGGPTTTEGGSSSTDGTPPDTGSSTAPVDTGTESGSLDSESGTTLAETGTDTDVPDTETETDTETDTEGTLPGCECIVDEAHDQADAAPAAPTCGDSLCADVAGACPNSCGDEPFELEDPAALECALVALRDRTPGIVSWSWSENAGQYDDDGYVLVNEDGTAVHRRWGWQDLDFEASAAVLGQLPSAEYFDACLAEPDDLARFDCLRAPLESTLGVCDEAWGCSFRRCE